jgi:hypothetical protein
MSETPMSESDSPPPDARGPGVADVGLIDELAVKYDFTAPDTFVGPESSRYVLDYGGPSVIADSRNEAFQVRAERYMWEGFASKEDTKTGLWQRLGAWFRRVRGRQD